MSKILKKPILGILQDRNPAVLFWLIVLEFNDTSTLVVILCGLPEKGRKEIVEEMKERDWEDRGTGMKMKKQ